MTAPTAWGPGLKRIGSFLFREELLVSIIIFIFWDSQARATEQNIQSADVKIIRKERLHMKLRDILITITYPAMRQLNGEPSSATIANR
jgi:hypothetical protein